MPESRSKREVEIMRTNWTQLADQWLQAKERIEDQFGVTLLPTGDKLRELPPTHETKVEGMNAEQLKRV